jgi:hypothetical protein
VQYRVGPGDAVAYGEPEVEPGTPRAIQASPGVIGSPVLTDWYDDNASIDNINEEDLDTDHDDALLLQAVDDIIGPTAAPGFATHVLDTGGGDQLFMISVEEPSLVTHAV